MLLDLPTRQDMQALEAKLNTVLELLARAPAPTADDLLSVEQVAAYTRFDRRTVEKWVEEGQFNETGRKVYLPAHRYSGRLRFKRGDVEAFGLGIGVLTPSLGGGQPEAVKPAPKKATPRAKAPQSSENVLRVA